LSDDHTPAPWEFSDAKTFDGEFMVTGGYGPSFGLVAAVTEAADARVIAAAPDMMDALEEMLSAAAAMGTAFDPHAMQQARNALAKAQAS
jgi:hypothetical protein